MWCYIKEGVPEKSKLAQRTCDEGHRVGWDEARIMKVESNSRYRKYKESGPCDMFNQFNQPAHFGHFSHIDPLYQQ
jgi:hypothetical protein